MGDFPIKYNQTRMNWTPETKCTSGGVAQVVLAAGNKWRGGDERRIGDQNADKMNLHDAHWFSDDHARDAMHDLENAGHSDAVDSQQNAS